EMQEAARWLADKERARLQLGDQPIGDIFSLLENQGLRIIRIAIPNSKLDGAFAYERNKGAFALVNASRSKGKQTFTAAHEYCHFLKDRADGYHPCQIHDDYTAQLRQKELERFANVFATHFLMPETGVREVVESQFGLGHGLRAEEVIYLKRYFGVSYIAMLLRLRELGYLSEERYEQLARVRVIALERRLYGDAEVDREQLEAPPRVPPLLAVLALEAYNRGLISLSRLAEIWRMKSAEAQEILREAGYVDEQ
ncbi:MAG TPA: ImmA/IrrE family metallo-endopeptidase, partial [Armatimonadetes bacterium]|nr:ImmA/IrrE family metallo-endopeptidase [Armatimonadota bacterium]